MLFCSINVFVAVMQTDKLSLYYSSPEVFLTAESAVDAKDLIIWQCPSVSQK